MKITLLFFTITIFIGAQSVNAGRCEARRLCHTAGRMAALCCGCKTFFRLNGRDVLPYMAVKQSPECGNEECIKPGSLCDKARNKVTELDDELQKDLPEPNPQSNDAPVAPVAVQSPEGAENNGQQDDVKQADRAPAPEEDENAAKEAKKAKKQAAAAKRKAAKKLKKEQRKAARKAAKRLAKKQAAAARKASRKLAKQNAIERRRAARKAARAAKKAEKKDQ